MSTDNAQDTPVADDGLDATVPETPAAQTDATDAVDPDRIIAELEARIAELEDRNLRLRADFDNLRKRSARELVDVRSLAKANTIEEFLPTLDHFGMAMRMIEQSEDVAMIKQGMQMIHAEFERCFESLGVTKLHSTGKIFDPHQHDAMSAEPSDSVPDQHIIREWSPGYQLGERLLRPAKVVVSSGPAPAAPDTADTADTSADSEA